MAKPGHPARCSASHRQGPTRPTAMPASARMGHLPDPTFRTCRGISVPGTTVFRMCWPASTRMQFCIMDFSRRRSCALSPAEGQRWGGGDAAHAMAPFLGRGACEAIVDGAALGRCLAQAPTVEAGLAAYDKARRKRTQRLVLSSRLMGSFAMLRAGAALRNAAMAAFGSVTRVLKPGLRSQP